MERQLTFETIKYGMLVEYHHPEGGGYHSGVKVHFFNRKGVLIGNLYEFVPYERLRRRLPYRGKNMDYQRFFYEKPYETIKNRLLVGVLNIVTSLMRFTQKFMD